MARGRRAAAEEGDLDDILLKPVAWNSRRDARGRMVVSPDENRPVAAGHTRTHLLDVTADGARMRAGGLRTGDSVSLVVDGFVPLRAVVAWTTLGEAGLDFRRPIHATMVHHLARLTPRGG